MTPLFERELAHGLVVGVWSDDFADDSVLMAEEVAAARDLTDSRRRTFVAGRAAMRLALGRSALSVGPVISSPRGAPILPSETGVSISISHKEHVAVALVRDGASAERFAAEIAGMRRIGHEGVTAIALAIERSRRLFGGNGFEGARRVIDVSGDGHSNQGPAVGPARRRAEADGITINGLAIVNEQPRLDEYYRRNVIAGPGAFVIEAADYDDFARAIRAKLVREIRGAGLALR